MDFKSHLGSTKLFTGSPMIKILVLGFLSQVLEELVPLLMNCYFNFTKTTQVKEFDYFAKFLPQYWLMIPNDLILVDLFVGFVSQVSSLLVKTPSNSFN